MKTPHKYAAAVVRDVLTAADVNLRRGSKAEIERLIVVALAKADSQWPTFAKEETARKWWGNSP